MRHGTASTQNDVLQILLENHSLEVFLKLSVKLEKDSFENVQENRNIVRHETRRLRSRFRKRGC